MSQTQTQSQTQTLREKIVFVRNVLYEIEKKINVVTNIPSKLNNLIDIVDDGYGEIVMKKYKDRIFVCIDVTPIFDTLMCEETESRNADEIYDTVKKMIDLSFKNIVSRILMMLRLDPNIPFELIEEDVRKIESVVYDS